MIDLGNVPGTNYAKRLERIAYLYQNHIGSPSNFKRVNSLKWKTSTNFWIDVRFTADSHHSIWQWIIISHAFRYPQPAEVFSVIRAYNIGNLPVLQVFPDPSLSAGFHKYVVVLALPIKSWIGQWIVSEGFEEALPEDLKIPSTGRPRFQRLIQG
jgi:hypothetical protein